MSLRQGKTIMPGWTVLPTVPLIGVGTSLVESVEHYVARLAWIVGVNGERLRNLPPLADESDSIGKSNSLGSIYKRRIRHLEVLTGNPTIRCGSLYVLDELLSLIGSGSKLARRWCPMCLLMWDSADSCEPLLWKIKLLEVCPLHGCRLETICRQCEATQTYGRSYHVRRRCRRCGAELGGGAAAIRQTNSQVWVQHQLSELVRFCATPGQSVVSIETFRAFTDGLLAVSPGRSPIPGVIRALIGKSKVDATSRRVTLRTLLNLCALQGVSIVDVLADPVGAASEPLIDLWSTYRALDLPLGSHESKIRMYNAAAAAVLRICRRVYLPSMRLFMHELHLNRDLARELSTDLYETYEAVYRAQGSEGQLMHAERCFLDCASFLKQPRLARDRQFAVRSIAAQIARKKCISLERAMAIALSARYALRAINRAKAAVNDSWPGCLPAVIGERPTRSNQSFA